MRTFKVTGEDAARLRLFVEADKIRFRRSGDESDDVYTYRLHPAAAPKGINLIEPRKVTKAIYEVKDDRLTLVLPPEGGERPTSLAASPDSNCAVLTFERVER
jgi:uncharacterized protein (TIGR03067 family)